MALEAGRASPCARLYWVLTLVFIHLTTSVTATNLTSSDNQTAEAVGTGGTMAIENDVVPKSLVAVGILAGAVAIGAVVAKLVDFIHDRKSLQDDASDMSEYTRVLLKRKALLAFTGNRKNGDGADEYGDGSGVKLPPELVALKLGKQWSFKTSQRKLQRERSQGSDIEKGSSVGDPDADMLAFTISSGQPAVANLVTTTCEVAGVSVSSLRELAVPSQAVLASPGSPVRRLPSLTVDELEDDVFMEEAVYLRQARRGSGVRTPTPSMIARVQVGRPGSSSIQAARSDQSPTGTAVTSPPPATQTPFTEPPATQTPATQTGTAQSPAAVLALQMSSRPKSSRTRSPPKSPRTAAGSWLYKDHPPGGAADLAPVHGATPHPGTHTADTAAASAATVAAVSIDMDPARTSSPASMTSIRHDQRPQSPLGALDVPERPANPVPPSSRAECGGNTPPRTPTPIVVNSKGFTVRMDEEVDDEGVVYSCDDKRPTTGGGGKWRTGRTNTGKAAANKTAFSSKSDIRKIFQRAPSAKRPQTAKKVTSSNNGTAKGSRAGATSAGGRAAAEEATSGAEAQRPKTAGPIRTGNRPVSAKPSRKITPGVRLKSAKR